MHDLFNDYPVISAPSDPCRCGATQFSVTPGRGPHAAALRCTACHAFRRWLSKVEYEAFLAGEDY